jgi:hypothetical protein
LFYLSILITIKPPNINPPPVTAALGIAIAASPPLLWAAKSSRPFSSPAFFLFLFYYYKNNPKGGRTLLHSPFIPTAKAGCYSTPSALSLAQGCFSLRSSLQRRGASPLGSREDSLFLLPSTAKAGIQRDCFSLFLIFILINKNKKGREKQMEIWGIFNIKEIVKIRKEGAKAGFF